MSGLAFRVSRITLFSLHVSRDHVRILTIDLALPHPFYVLIIPFLCCYRESCVI